MTVSITQPRAKSERIAQTLLLLALGCVAFSTFLTNLFVYCCYLFFVAALLQDRTVRTGLGFAPSLLAFALLGLFIVGASWSIGPSHEVAQGVRKYSKLLILPIAIALAWRDATLSKRALPYYMAGAAWLALSCYLVWFNLMPTSRFDWWRVGDAKDAFAYKNHITVGIMLGFATLICLLKASYAEQLRNRLAALAGAVLFAFPILFLTQGRTGYVVLLIGLVTLLLLRVGAHRVRLAGGVLGIAVLFVSLYFASTNFKSRTDQLVADVQGYANADARSPNGMRLSFFQVGGKAIAEHPWFGNGTGSFAELYAPTARAIWPADSPHHNVRIHPHSEFLGVAVQLGLLGFLVYLAMLASLGRVALGARSFEGDSMLLLWVIYVSTSLYNSMLWDPAEAYWFLLLAGCLYAGNRRRRGAPQVA
ncbi:MAG: O-antigen ligase family protein [Burkholderiaceae bacterium]|nr:O-antigen ligase family protein [Burkholderiaceae bacterium]